MAPNIADGPTRTTISSSLRSTIARQASEAPPRGEIDHTKTKVKSPQTNGICERFHKTILQEFYQIAFRKRLYETIEQLQADLDVWLDTYNTKRTHQGKMCCGRTPFETMIEGKDIWKEKYVS